MGRQIECFTRIEGASTARYLASCGWNTYPSDRLGPEIRIAHYPPYCSKHNPIEHRLFAHVTRTCQGVVFHTVEIARKFIAMTKTTKGLKVTVDILSGVYVNGKKVAADFKKTMRIVFDEDLRHWNYRAIPAKG